MTSISLKEPDKKPQGECAHCHKAPTCSEWWRSDVEANGGTAVCCFSTTRQGYEKDKWR